MRKRLRLRAGSQGETSFSRARSRSKAVGPEVSALRAEGTALHAAAPVPSTCLLYTSPSPRD
eukprot:2191696-Alexandrium_andersonii.AAC.1